MNRLPRRGRCESGRWYPISIKTLVLFLFFSFLAHSTRISLTLGPASALALHLSLSYYPPHHCRHGSFTLEIPHPTPDAGSVVESDDEQADSDIDSDVSDAELLELKQELKKLGPEKAQ